MIFVKILWGPKVFFLDVLVTPHYGDCVQDGLVMRQDGLVTPSLWGLPSDLFKKRSKFVKNRQNRIKITFCRDCIHLQWNFDTVSINFR